MKNRYTIAFPFKGEYQYATFDANMVTNILLYDICGDELGDVSEEYGQWFTHRFCIGHKHYMATFDIGNPKLISVYETNDKSPDSDEYDEHRIEDGIPYHVIKIINGDKVVYNLADLI